MPPPRQQTMPDISMPSTVLEVEKVPRRSISTDSLTKDVDAGAALNLRIANPMAGMTHADLLEDGRGVALSYLQHPEEAAALSQGALVAANPSLIDTNPEYFERESIDALKYEREHPWKSMPSKLVTVVVINSLCAAVQGMGMSRCRQYSIIKLMYRRRNGRQWRAAILQRAIWHPGFTMDPRSGQLSALSGLCCSRLLARYPVEPPLWSQGDHFHLLCMGDRVLHRSSMR